MGSGRKHLIFRFSWVYAARGNKFAKTMLKLAKDRLELNVITDQVGVPNGADFTDGSFCGSVAASVRNPELGRIYHLAPAGETSWYAYAKSVIKTTRAHGELLAVQAVNRIDTTQYFIPACRPSN